MKTKNPNSDRSRPGLGSAFLPENCRLAQQIFHGGAVRAWPAGFTRVELLAVMLVLGLLAFWVWPALAQTKPRSERLQCLGNLRLIGLAFQLWGNDHNDTLPWRVLPEVPPSEGGTLPPAGGSKVGAAWYEFAWVSNQLKTPKILVCPSDTATRRVAKDFSSQPGGGFLHFNYRGNALSYFVGLDVWPELTRGVLSGDRNLKCDFISSCSTRINNAATIRVIPPSATVAAWTNNIHWPSGNLLLNDGQVLETDSGVMRQRMQTGDDNGVVHLLLP